MLMFWHCNCIAFVLYLYFITEVMDLLHNLQTTRHSTHHTKIILIQKGNKFITKDKVVSYKVISIFNENPNMFIIHKQSGPKQA